MGSQAHISRQNCIRQGHGLSRGESWRGGRLDNRGCGLENAPGRICPPGSWLSYGTRRGEDRIPRGGTEQGGGELYGDCLRRTSAASVGGIFREVVSRQNARLAARN